MRLAICLLMLAVLAAPALAVDILEVRIGLGDDVTIRGIERFTGPQITSTDGSWTLQVLGDDRVLYENGFDPYMIGLDSEPELLDEMYVDVQTGAGAVRVQVLDEDGIVRATDRIGIVCGDGTCNDIEIGTCSMDCLLVQEGQAAEERIATQSQTGQGMARWKVLLIAASLFMIIILILVLIHLNRNKKNPVALDTGRAY